jgi:hypothetical protein
VAKASQISSVDQNKRFVFPEVRVAQQSSDRVIARQSIVR